MKSNSSFLLNRLITTILFLFSIPLSMGAVAQQAYVKGTNTAFRDQLGTSVAISGDTMVVGVPGDRFIIPFLPFGLGNIPPANKLGKVYVFVKSEGAWAQQAVLQASNAQINDYFGSSVAISGDTIVVGATDERSNASGVNGNQADTSLLFAGAAYVFVRSGTTWSQQAYIKASNPGREDSFGNAVAISGDTIVVGASGERSNASGVNGNEADDSFFGAGAAYVFVRIGTTWSQQAYLKASNTDRFYNFGNAVAVDNNTIVVGAHREWSNATGINGNQADRSAESSGATYIFVRDGTAWTQQAYLKASNTEEDDRFGKSVAISGDTVVIGAHYEDSQATGFGGNQADNSASDSGAAYVFTRSCATWSQQAYLKASNTDGGDFFGESVAIEGDTILVGAPLEYSQATGIDGDQADNSIPNVGATYLFTRHSGTWSQQAYLKASHSTVGFYIWRGDKFGTSVAISGGSLIVGAPDEGSSTTGINNIPNIAEVDGTSPLYDSFLGSGATYVFQFTPTPPSAVTLAATSLTPQSAVLNSQVNAGLNPTAVQFEYAENPMGPFTSVTVPGGANGSVTFPKVTLPGLQQGTTYYFRASGSSILGSSTGDVLSFTTPYILPILSVDGARTAITDIHTAGSSYPHEFTAAGGELYLVADDAVQGTLLRRVTAGGSEIVADVNGVSTDSAGYANLTDVNGKLYFTADNAVNGTELWKLESTGPVMVTDLKTGIAGSFPNQLTVINGVLYFTAETAANGREIWRLSPAGVPVLTEVETGTDGSFPENLTRVGNRLFFSATTIATGTELWYLNDTFQAVLIDDDAVPNGGLTSGDDSVTVGQMKAVGDSLYFDTTAGFISSERKLWRVNTTAGTVNPAELIFTTTASLGPPGSQGFPYPANFTSSGSSVYFTGSTLALGAAVWKISSTVSPAAILVNLTQPADLVDVNGTLYFTGDDGTNGQELWRTTITGVESLGTTFPNRLTAVNGQLFFNATDIANGQELWRIATNGSPAMVADASPGTDSSTLFDIVAIGRRIYFTMSTAEEGLELWTLDSLGVPRLVEGSRVNSTIGNDAGNLMAFQGTLYFQANNGLQGSELWRTTNTMPTVNVLAGNTALCNGLIDKALDVPGLILSASIGTVTLNAAAGTWSWSKPNATSGDAGVITITASISSTALATAQFQLTVTSNFLSYAAWVTSYGLTGPDANPSTSLPNDGIPNLLRYAFNLSPSVNSPASILPGVANFGMPAIYRVNTPSGSFLHYEYVRRRGATVIYNPRKSINLIDWEPLTAAPIINILDAAWERISYDEPIPPSGAERMFGSVEITHP